MDEAAAQAFTEPVQEILYDINTLNASKDIVQNLEAMMNDISIKTEEKQDLEKQLYWIQSLEETLLKAAIVQLQRIVFI